MKTLLQYPAGKTASSYTIPDGVVSIGNYAFTKDNMIREIIMPDSVVTIGERAFWNCCRLEKVVLSSSVVSISSLAFYDVPALREIYYGGNETDRSMISIGSNNTALEDAFWHYGDIIIADEDQQVTVEYLFEKETATIGQPFTVNYEIIGGSGQYERISYCVDEITEHCRIGKLCGDLYNAKGSFTIVPEVGEYINVWIIFKDTVTGIYWSSNQSGNIVCAPNPEITVTFSGLPEIIATNEGYMFSYAVNTSGAIHDGKIEAWEFKNDDIYPECTMQGWYIERSGNADYSTLNGKQVFFVIYGKDAAGRPFYAKTNRIDVLGYDALSNCLILPASINRIEEEAFTAVKASRVYIPASVQHIDKNAFTNSRITTILGNSAYVEEYALKNGFHFVRYDLLE